MKVTRRDTYALLQDCSFEQYQALLNYLELTNQRKEIVLLYYPVGVFNTDILFGAKDIADNSYLDNAIAIVNRFIEIYS